LPDVEAVAAELGDRVRFVKVDIDRDETVREQFGISGLPSYLVFRDGVEVDRLGFTFLDTFLRWRLRRLVTGALE
jgi:thioredoxin-like negative regulator of GroEL